MHLRFEASGINLRMLLRVVLDMSGLVGTVGIGVLFVNTMFLFTV